MNLPSFFLALAGFTGLCLAMERHHEQVFGSRRIPSGRGRRLRWAGWLLLAASLLPPVLAQGWGFGLVSWAGLLTAAALLLVLLLAYRPGVVAVLGAVSLPLGLLLLLLPA